MLKYSLKKDAFMEPIILIPVSGMGAAGRLEQPAASRSGMYQTGSLEAS